MLSLSHHLSGYCAVRYIFKQSIPDAFLYILEICFIVLIVSESVYFNDYKIICSGKEKEQPLCLFLLIFYLIFFIYVAECFYNVEWKIILLSRNSHFVQPGVQILLSVFFIDSQRCHVVDWNLCSDLACRITFKVILHAKSETQIPVISTKLYISYLQNYANLICTAKNLMTNLAILSHT